VGKISKGEGGMKQTILIYDTGKIYAYEIDTDALPEWVIRSQIITPELL
jgi:hypothetical protein